MRIRKISQSAAIPGKIVNSPSDSTTETYSCDYINDVSVVVSPTEPVGVNRKKVWLQNVANQEKMYVKNDNNVYEEFMKKEEYSTSEVRIGTWIDGKPLYQRTFVTTAPHVTTDGTMATNIIPINSNIENIFIHQAMADNTYMLPVINGTITRLLRIDVYKNAAPPNITLYSNNSSWNGLSITFTVRYTKTTD